MCDFEEDDFTVEYGTDLSKIDLSALAVGEYAMVIEGTLNDVEIEYNDLGEVKVNFSYKNKLFKELISIFNK